MRLDIAGFSAGLCAVLVLASAGWDISKCPMSHQCPGEMSHPARGGWRGILIGQMTGDSHGGLHARGGRGEAQEIKRQREAQALGQVEEVVACGRAAKVAIDRLDDPAGSVHSVSLSLRVFAHTLQWQ